MKILSTLRLLALLPLFLTALLPAQPSGLLDQAFGQTGLVTYNFSGGLTQFYASVRQSDGKMLAIGYVYGGQSGPFLVARFLPDGSLDTGFGQDGLLTLPQDIFSPFHIVVDESDRFIVGAGGPAGHFNLARFQPNGAPDLSFGVNGLVDLKATPNYVRNQIVDLVRLDDGRLTFCGIVDIYGKRDMLLARFLPDGAPDATFGVQGVVYPAFSDAIGRTCLGVQSNGKMLFSITEKNGTVVLSRLASDGTPDTTFANSGQIWPQLSLAGWRMLSDNTFYIANRVDGAGGALYYLSRHFPDGSRDSAFAPAGRSENPFGGLIRNLEDGSYLLGVYKSKDIAVVHYFPEGVVDSSYGSAGTVVIDFNDKNDRLFDLVEDPADHTVFVLGGSEYDNKVDAALARLQPGGQFAPAFGGGNGKITYNFGKSRDVPGALLSRRDGKIIMAGSTDTGYDRNQMAVVAFGENGHLDTAYASGGQFTRGWYGQYWSEYSVDMAALPDTGVAICGSVGYGYSQPDYLTLIKLRKDGQPDSLFGTGGHLETTFGLAADYYSNILFEASGDTLFSAALAQNYSVQPIKQWFVVSRWLSDGTPDSAYGIGGNFISEEDSVKFITASALPGGGLTAFRWYLNDSVWQYSVVPFRLTAQGLPDSSFQAPPPLVFPAGLGITYILPVTDGGALFAFKTNLDFFGEVVLKFLRVTGAGRVDSAFGTNGWLTYSPAQFGFFNVETMKQLPGGDVLLLGQGYDYDQEARFWWLIRLTATGLDTLSGAMGNIQIPTFGWTEPTLAVQPDGKILIGFTLDNKDFALVRLLPGLDVGVLEPGGNSSFFRMAYPNPVRREPLTLAYTLPAAAEVRLTLHRLDGRQLWAASLGRRTEGRQEESIQLPPGLTAGNYLLQVSAGNRQAAVQIVYLPE